MPKGADERIIEAASGTHATPGAMLRMLAAGCLTGALLGGQPLLGWAESLDAETPINATVIAATQVWHATLSRFGADRPYAYLHAQLKLLQSQRFLRGAP